MSCHETSDHHPDSDRPSNIKTESGFRQTTIPSESQFPHAPHQVLNAVSNNKKYERGIEVLSTPRCELVRQVLETSQRSRFGSRLRPLNALSLLDLPVERNKLVDRVKKRLHALFRVNEDEPTSDRVAQAEIAQEDREITQGDVELRLLHRVGLCCVSS